MSLKVFFEAGGSKVAVTPDDPWPEAVVECKDKSLARQSEADSADINKIIARYEKTGILPVDEREALFIDVSEMSDYRSAVEQVRLVQEYFAQLPAGTRAAFGNEPARLLDFMSDPANEAKARELGLVEPADKPVAPAVSPPAQAGGAPA